MTELRDVTCHMESHSMAVYPTQVNAPRLNPSPQAGTRFRVDGRLSLSRWLSTHIRVTCYGSVAPVLHFQRPKNTMLELGSRQNMTDMDSEGHHFKSSLTTTTFYRAMHFSAYARSWDRMSSVRPPYVCPSR